MILDYFLIPLLSVAYAALTANRMLPLVPYWVWAIPFTVPISAINVRGLRMTARAGNVMIVLMTVCAALFVAVTAHSVVVHRGFRGLFVGRTVYNPQTFSAHPLMLGAAIASLSYIGFDAISTLAEDTIDPQRDIRLLRTAAFRPRKTRTPPGDDSGHLPGDDSGYRPGDDSGHL